MKDYLNKKTQIKLLRYKILENLDNFLIQCDNKEIRYVVAACADKRIPGIGQMTLSYIINSP